MELYIGGFAQGKLAYVMAKYPEAPVYDEKNFSELLQAGREPERGGEECGNEPVIWNHFQLAVKTLLEEGRQPSEIWETIQKAADVYPKLIVISDEIGGGIVPMERSERIYREETGRMLCRIAAKADLVERIFCGLSKRLK